MKDFLYLRIRETGGQWTGANLIAFFGIAASLLRDLVGERGRRAQLLELWRAFESVVHAARWVAVYTDADIANIWDHLDDLVEVYERHFLATKPHTACIHAMVHVGQHLYQWHFVGRAGEGNL